MHYLGAFMANMILFKPIFNINQFFTMKKLCSLLAFASLLLFLAQPLSAQIQTPAPSPTVELKTKVGLTDVSVLYSRPSAKGRAIFGSDAKAVVPFGSMWRTGANSATKLSFGDDVTIGGTAVKKGDYALFSSPGASEWKVMLFTYDTPNAGGYGDKTAAATWTLKPVKLNDKVETFTIEIADVAADKANIAVSWENTRINLPLMVEVDKRVQANIERVLAGPSQNDYSAAAGYYHDNKKDLNKALEWIKKANASDAKYWNVRREALILADLGRKPEAIAAATKSLEMAKAANNQDYVRMNEQSLKDWK
jgi:hypothetical protein